MASGVEAGGTASRSRYWEPRRGLMGGRNLLQGLREILMGRMTRKVEKNQRRARHGPTAGETGQRSASRWNVLR